MAKNSNFSEKALTANQNARSNPHFEIRLNAIFFYQIAIFDRKLAENSNFSRILSYCYRFGPSYVT